MDPDCKHVCMLTQEPKFYDLPPTAKCFKYFLRQIRELMLPCEWHHGVFQFIRSQKSLQLERERQVQVGHWFIWHPYSPIKYYWDCFMMFFSYLSLLYIPLQVFYNCPNPYDPFILVSDALTFLDIFSKFITGRTHEDGKKVVLEPKAIVRQYLKGTFIFDLLSALPLQCITIFKIDCQFPTHTVWFGFKLFRMVAITEQWKNFAKQIRLSYVAALALIILFRVILFFHWTTYSLYQTPAFCAHYYKYDPKAIQWFHHLYVLDDSSKVTVFEKYMANLFYAFGMCIGSGHFNLPDHYLVPELILNSAIGIVGLVFLTYAYSTLLRLGIYARYEVILYHSRLKELSKYMVFKNLPKTLQKKIQLYMNYKFQGHYFNEQNIMDTINEQIKQDINMHCCKRLVQSVPLFQNMPTALINTIVFSLKEVLYMPGETIMKCGQPGNSIYMIYSGTVAVIDSAGREAAHLRDGAFFGEQALLKPGILRSVTIVALEITEIFKLNSHEFQACLQPYPQLKRRLEEAGASSARRGRRRRVRTDN